MIAKVKVHFFLGHPLQITGFRIGKIFSLKHSQGQFQAPSGISAQSVRPFLSYSVANRKTNIHPITLSKWFNVFFSGFRPRIRVSRRPKGALRPSRTFEVGGVAQAAAPRGRRRRRRCWSLYENCLGKPWIPFILKQIWAFLGLVSTGTCLLN